MGVQPMYATSHRFRCWLYNTVKNKIIDQKRKFDLLSTILYFRYMDIDRRVVEIIEAAQQALAGLANEAGEAKDYARAGSLYALAQRIADAAQPVDVVRSAPFQAAPSPAAHQGWQEAPKQHLREPVNSNQDALRLAKRAGSAQYPRFKREDDTLVKIGWSKSDKATYEHRSPRSILQNLARRIQEVGGNGLRFTTEQLLPLLDEKGAELPSYQCYLCLAWLVADGLVDRHGRQGYTLHVQGDLNEAIDVAWQSLPKR
jgi:hypothetical protein